jgi:hypothetical protein
MSKSGKIGKVFVSGTEKQVYGFKIPDNSSKYGSTVKRNPDGSFPYDDKMKKTNPKEWNAMIKDRVKVITDNK